MINFSQKKGFTLIETLVAIAVLVLAISGAFTAAQSGLSSYQHSKNQAIAINLAQEAVEAIRANRDSNILSGNNWMQGMGQSSDPCYSTDTIPRACILDISSVPISISSCGTAGTCPFLRQNSTTGYYGYNSTWPLTVFKREIQITSITSSEVSVLVTVTWSKGVSTKQYKTRTYLFDW